MKIKAQSPVITRLQRLITELDVQIEKKNGEIKELLEKKEAARLTIDTIGSPE